MSAQENWEVQAMKYDKMTNQDMMHLIHTADEPQKHMGAVVAPIQDTY